MQTQHDYLQGNYPVAKEDAAHVCALQMQAEFASTLADDEDAILASIEKYITKQVGQQQQGNGFGYGLEGLLAGCSQLL